MSIRAAVILAFFLLFAAACRGEHDEDCCVPPPPRDPTSAELQWLSAVCEAVGPALAEERVLPGFGQSTATMSIEEFHAWAASLWPARIEIHDRLLAELEVIEPPGGKAPRIHEAIMDFSSGVAADLRAALQDLEEGVLDSDLAAHQRVLDLMDAEADAVENVDDAFFDGEPVLFLRQDYEECTGMEL